MIDLPTLSALEDLEREMARCGRLREESALHAALNALVRPERGFLTTGRAAERVGVSIPTIKRWVERGVLAGGTVGGRWFVAQESLEQFVRLRKSLTTLDQEGNPSPNEVDELYHRSNPLPQQSCGTPTET